MRLFNYGQKKAYRTNGDQNLTAAACVRPDKSIIFKFKKNLKYALNIQKFANNPSKQQK